MPTLKNIVPLIMKVTKAAMFDVKLSNLVVHALKIRGSSIKENRIV